MGDQDTKKKFTEEIDEWLVKAIHGSIASKKNGGNLVNLGPVSLPKNVSRRYDDYSSD
jgi:hypothetical protein